MEFTSIRTHPLNVDGFSKGLSVPGATKEEIEKGSFSDIFGYSKNVEISKTGKEVKEALEGLLPKEVQEKEELYSKMRRELEECDHHPAQEPSNYLFNGLKHKMEVVPNMFSYDVISQYSDKGDGNNSNLTVQEEPSSHDHSGNHYEKYNEYAREYIRACVDIIKLRTMINNINEKSKYDLSVEQAAMLGF